VKIKSEKGQVLPLVMIAIMIGAMVIPPFLGHAGSSLIGSRTYRESLDAQYACDSGAEHAIWNLTDGGIAASIPNDGDTVSYSLPELINGLTTNVTICNCIEDMHGYAINATAGNCLIAAVVGTDNGTVNVLSWYFK
jgi:hypothetical protein